MKKAHKYKISFSSQVKPLVSKDMDKYLALAAEANFKKFLPKDIDFDEKIDFLGFAGESFIANRLNLNEAGVDTKEAIRIANLFPLSFVDADHKRDQIVGVIVNSSFAEFGTGKELTLDDIKDTNSPFSVIIGGIIWRVPNPKFAEAVEESSNPNSEYFNKFFLSWELLFSEMDLIIMDKNKYNFEDGTRITDEAEIKKLSNKLRNFGGSGYTDDGKKIGMVIKNDSIPVAVGIVESPAAKVLPISTNVEKEKVTIKSSKSNTYICPSCEAEMEMEDEMDDEEEMECGKCKEKSMGKKWKVKADKNNENLIKAAQILTNKSELTINQSVEAITNAINTLTNIKIFQNSNSQSQINAVKANNDNKKQNKVMLKTLANLKDEDLKEATASEIIKASKIDLDAEVEKINNEWLEKKNKVDTELKASNDKIKELEDKYKAEQEKIVKVQEDLNKLVKANQDREQEETFNTRMNYFDQEYDLSEEKIRNIVARKIKGANEEQYKEAKEEIELLLAAKKKAKKAEMTDEEKEEMKKKMDKESKASTEKTEENDTQNIVDNAIDNGEKTKTTVAATTAPVETEAEKWKKAFGEDGWEVDKRAFRR